MTHGEFLLVNKIGLAACDQDWGAVSIDDRVVSDSRRSGGRLTPAGPSCNLSLAGLGSVVAKTHGNIASTCNRHAVLTHFNRLRA
jgi:hypothetical protein